MLHRTATLVVLLLGHFQVSLCQPHDEVVRVGECNADDVNAYITSIPSGSQCLEAISIVLEPTNFTRDQLSDALQTFCTAECGQVIATYLITVCHDLDFAFVLNLYCIPTAGSSLLGEYCRQTFPDAINGSYISDLEPCETFDTNSPTCPESCKEALDSAVANIGCCYQFLYHSTNEILSTLLPNSFFRAQNEQLLDVVSNPALWTSCTIPLVNLCSGQAFPIAPGNGIGTCSVLDLNQFLAPQSTECTGNFNTAFGSSAVAIDIRQSAFDAVCTQDCVQPLTEYLSDTCGDPVASIKAKLACFHSEGSLGNRCYFSLSEDFRNSDTFDAVRMLCLSFTASTPTCPSGCANALRSLISQIGCCYQSIFNSTLIQHALLVDGRISIDERYLYGAISRQALWDSCEVPLTPPCTLDPYQPASGMKCFSSGVVLVTLLQAALTFFVM